MKKNKSIFNYVIIAAVLLIPFMYSFFYLKAYWNPYGDGNIDNIPVAIVNEDNGNKGNELIDSIKDSKKLKINVVNKDEASSGLDDTTYYAVITIPEDFSESMESISTTNKKHATITYSPNQKSNYLASQIINSVVNAVEKNLDNKVNSEIVGNLSDNLNEVPEKLTTIEDGFSKLNDGTKKLKNGSNELNNGVDSLKTNYSKFNDGIYTLKNGVNTLNDATSKFASINTSITTLQNGVSTIKTGSDTFTTSLDSYTTTVNSLLSAEKNMVIACQAVASGNTDATVMAACKSGAILTTKVNNIILAYENYPNHNGIDTNTYYLAKQLKNYGYGELDLVSAVQKLGSVNIVQGNKQLNAGLTQLNTSVQGLSTLGDKLTELQTGINQINTGVNTLADNSTKINNGITSLSDGSEKLNNGIGTLDSSVSDAKSELSNKINDTKNDLKSLDGLKEYSEAPVTVNTEVKNEVSSYGTAFAPLFISIALWVGALMSFVVLYYDKQNRFEKLSIDCKNRVKRNLRYYGLATLSGLVLGVLLQLFLDLEITNVCLYYVSVILVANTFMALMQFLIVNFGDIGKFVGLIILVLQLAASGGTFPIETVTKGFRFLNGLLPMTYTIRLLRESVVTIESSLLVKNMVIVFIIFVVFFTITIISDYLRQKKNME